MYELKISLDIDYSVNYSNRIRDFRNVGIQQADYFNFHNGD